MAEAVTATTLAAQPGLAHGFFTRRGGVSAGSFAALNCSLSGRDDPDAVRRVSLVYRDRARSAPLVEAVLEAIRAAAK